MSGNTTLGTWRIVVFAGALVACASHPERPFNAPAATHTDSQPAGDYDFVRQAGAPAHAQADQTGLATWYGAKFAGKRTSNGERFDPRAMTAAHRKLPFGTWVEVRDAETGRTVRVRINDRGPWGDSRKVIDLSRAAAERLGIVAAGSARVELRVVSGPE